MTEITNKIYYVGVNDRNKHRFEGLWPLPNGVSYNSYIIDDEKVALVDTVEVDFLDVYKRQSPRLLHRAYQAALARTARWSDS